MHDLNLKLLEDLAALARTSNLYRAAELRNVTHPAFGRRIRALEEWAGVALVERGHQSTQLNAAGHTLLASAQEVLDILHDTREALQRPGRARATRITIAAGRMLSHSVLPPLLDDLQRAFPPVLWSVSTTSLEFGVEMLDRGEADLLLCHAPLPLAPAGEQPGRLGLRLGSDELVPVSAPLVPGYPRYRMPLAAADAEVPFLSYAPGMSLGRILRERLHALCAAGRLRTAYESDLVDAIHAMVRQGSGLAWLPLTLVQEDLARGALVRAAGPAKDIQVQIHLYRNAANAKPLLRRIWAHMEQRLPAQAAAPA